jgi:hypothetical protein
MKLVIVTAVQEFHKQVIHLFNEAQIENFSESDIDGYKNNNPIFLSSNWFAAEKTGNDSTMIFSFTEDQKIDELFRLIGVFNEKLETNNPLRAVVVPIEKYI